MTYEARLNESNIIEIFCNGEPVDSFLYQTDPSRSFFDMTEDEKREMFPTFDPELIACQSVEEYEQIIGRAIVPYDEWLPEIYDRDMEFWGWKRVGSWDKEAHTCSVIKKD